MAAETLLSMSRIQAKQIRTAVEEKPGVPFTYFSGYIQSKKYFFFDIVPINKAQIILMEN